MARKVFDKPASIATQQSWEDELNDPDTTPERRKQLEKKFAQQRDWEKRHSENKEELEEILNFNVPVNVTANGNDVAVGGIN